MPDSLEAAEHTKVGVQVRIALESYRSDPALADWMTEPFLGRMEIFAAALALWGAKINLTSRPQDPDETTFHIVDSLMPLALFPKHSAPPHFDTPEALSDYFSIDKHILDFGSGAGFPGLVLASACAARFTLVEARHKRASFLKVVAAEMALDNVEIHATRLNVTAIAPEFDAVSSRASGPASDFYQVAAGALRPGGLALLYASPSQRLDLEAAKRAGQTRYHRYRYSVRRGGVAVNRVLATWVNAGKS